MDIIFLILLIFGLFIVGAVFGYLLGHSKGMKRIEPVDEVDRLLEEIQNCGKITLIFNENEIRIGKDVQMRKKSFSRNPMIWYKKEAIPDLTKKQEDKIDKLVRFKIAEAAREQLIEELIE